jgi:hypothetical protein
VAAGRYDTKRRGTRGLQDEARTPKPGRVSKRAARYFNLGTFAHHFGNNNFFSTLFDNNQRINI